MKLLRYILVCGFLFALLDWKVVQYTRIANRDWLEWMHAHEVEYANVTRSVEFAFCAPALALKPIFYNAAMSSEASQQEQDAVTHAPKPTLSGFYHLPVRGQDWTFVSWFWWFSYWIPISLIWLWIVNKFQIRSR